jgi:hypothetical protein
MAKAPKLTTIEDSKPLQWNPDDWMPFTAAFPHIQQVEGGEELAVEALRLRLVSGEVEALERRVALGGGTENIPLAPEYFEDGPLFPRLPERISDLHREAHRQNNLMRRVEMLRFHGHNFFLRRAHVYRLWPIGRNAKKPRQAALPAKQPKGIGPKPWLAANKIWELWFDGYRWTDREALRRKVCGLLSDPGLSLRTLDEALAYLRRKRLIDR